MFPLADRGIIVYHLAVALAAVKQAQDEVLGHLHVITNK